MEKERKPTKKRKLDKQESPDTPILKKSKKKHTKKSVADGDEQWQKFIKLQNPATTQTGNKKKSATTMTTTTTTTTTANKNEKKTSKEEKKKKKKSNPLLKPREPYDLMRNEARSQELIDQIMQIENISESNHEQKALAVNLMPSRDRQTVETLRLGVEQYDVPPVTFNDIDFSIAIKRMNYERTAQRGNDHSYPLQDLMGDQGFLSVNNEHVEHVLKCIIKDKRNDINYAKYSKSEAAKAGNRNMALSANKNRGEGDTSNKKLNHIFGNNFHSFGYNRRTPQAQHKKMKAIDAVDKHERFKEFFKYDEIDEDETNFGKLPSESKMFRKLKTQNAEKFARRNETLRDAASLTPKPDVEVLSKEYILEFRQPPGTGDALCENGAKCIFNTFSPDKTARYIGKVFYTEREKARVLKQQINGQSEDDGHDNGNGSRLCIDCLLKSWTVRWSVNIRDEVIPERPINYFTVMCKPGQYSTHCMLSVVFNNKPTGIIGHVPRFSPNNRRIVTHQRTRRYDNKHETVSVPVLVETGMDF